MLKQATLIIASVVTLNAGSAHADAPHHFAGPHKAARRFDAHRPFVQITPPPARIEHAGHAPRPGYVWTPGYWSWDGGQYQWVAGSWQRSPGAGWTWQSAHWESESGQWVLIPGRWVLAQPTPPVPPAAAALPAPVIVAPAAPVRATPPVVAPAWQHARRDQPRAIGSHRHR